MAIIVVGGHTRNIGKTSVVANLIAALPELQWTAFKVTQFGHGICSANGKPCSCETGPHTIAISEERDPTTGTDSARFLAAGAVHSFWVRTRQGQLGEAMPRIRKQLASATNAILESNSILRFLKPDLYLTVLDSANHDFKSSAQNFLAQADAVLWSGRECKLAAIDTAEWSATLMQSAQKKPQFYLQAPTYKSSELTQFVAEHVAEKQRFSASRYGSQHQHLP